MMEKTLICPLLSFEKYDNNIDSESERIKEKLRYLFDQFTSSNIVFRYWSCKKRCQRLAYISRCYFFHLYSTIFSLAEDCDISAPL